MENKQQDNLHTNHQDRPKGLLRPEVAWPMAVIGLLLLSIGTMTTMVLATRSDGGAQVVQNYYQQAIAWDTQVAEKAASDALGWQATLALPTNEKALIITLVDREGQPVEEAVGTLTITRPHIASPLSAGPWEATDTPGVYRYAVALDGRGLWDFTLRVEKGEARFVTTIRREVR